MMTAPLGCDSIFDYYNNPKRKELFLSFSDEKTEKNLSGFKTQDFHALSSIVPP